MVFICIVQQKRKLSNAQAYENMKKHEIDALVIIGGDGSLTGARIFAQEFDVPCIGLPGTIDNDLYGTDTTIGYDTALNTILDAVDKIRDTATSHERLFFVEVMGRDAGFLALNGAIAAGAEAAIIPEFSTEVDQLEEFIEHGFRKSKSSSIVLVAESELTGGAMHYAERVKNEYPQYDVRVTILGHLQRGGRPTAHDRIIASRMGVASIQALLEGQRNVMIGIDDDKIVYVPFVKAIKNDMPSHGEAPGTVLATRPLTVACAEGAIQLLHVVPEGKKPMDGTSFAAGLRLKAGDCL